MLDVKVICPLLPDVPETRLKREPAPSFKTLAVTPTPVELMAVATGGALPDAPLSKHPLPVYCSSLVTSCCMLLAWASAEMPVWLRIWYFEMSDAAWA